MNQNAQSFMDTLDEKGIKYSTEELESDTAVTVGFNMENTSLRIRVFFDDDNAHVAFRCFGFVSIKQEQFANALMTCNKCNQDYRWVKFVIDDDLDVNAYDDAVTSPDVAGEECFELLTRILTIVDDCYPIFMKNIWG